MVHHRDRSYNNAYGVVAFGFYFLLELTQVLGHGSSPDLLYKRS